MESARRSSSLPSGVFKVRSPAIEQKIAGGVADVFLQHMSRVEGGLDVHHGDRPPGSDRQGPDGGVDQDAIRDLLADLRTHGDVAPPLLDEGLASERTFVLVDLSTRDDSDAKAAAIAELLQLAHAEPAFEGHDADALRRLCVALERIATTGAQNFALMQVRRTAEDLLRQREASR